MDLWRWPEEAVFDQQLFYRGRQTLQFRNEQNQCPYKIFFLAGSRLMWLQLDSSAI